MKNKVLKSLFAVLLTACIVLLASCGALTSTPTSTNTDPTITNPNQNTDPVTTDPAEDAKDNETEIVGDFTIATTVENGYAQSGSVYTITAAGEYTLSGTLEEGQILVNAGDDDKVTLVLNGTSITCSTDSPIYIQNADKVKINVSEGTYNTVTDARALQTDENDTTGKAAIYACCDLDLLGTGSLVVEAGYNNGIQTKDDLEIKSVVLRVTAPNNAIKGNDSLTIKSGNIIAISSAGDALKTENSDISSKGNQRGTITISGGTLELYAGCDGIDAAYDVVISGSPSILIKTNSYSSYTGDSLKVKASSSSSSGFRPGMPSESGNTNKSAESSKGIKADNQITISGGTVEIFCMDDGIHANSDNALENGASPLGNITVSGGSIQITAADDGIHADTTLQIDGGYINILTAYEGLEGHYVNITNGEVCVYATNDGVNAQGSTKNTSDGVITVSGGKVYVEVAGGDVDGIDSNGDYYQTGGFVVVSNPNANSMGTAAAVDTDKTISVTGGIIVALGTVPSSGGGSKGPGGPGGGLGASLPSGYVTYSGTLTAGEHTFTYGGTSYAFTLKNRVSGGWIWANGISSSNYSLN